MAGQQDDPLIEFSVRVLRLAAHGARIDWPWFCAYGKDIEKIDGLYLCVTALLDALARRGHSQTAEISLMKQRWIEVIELVMICAWCLADRNSRTYIPRANENVSK